MLQKVNFSRWGNRLLDGLLHLFYPLICLHCKALVETRSHLLCQKCSDLLELLSLEGRCERCFNEQPNCFHDEDYPFTAVVSAFEYLGPAASLVKAFKYSNQPYLSQTLASWMILQWSKQNLSMPDFITAVPMNRLKRFDRGYNQSELLAESIGKMLNRPVINPLKRKLGDFSQARLGEAMRREMQLETIYLNDAEAVYDKTILLVDDVVTTGNTLEKSGKALQEGAPKQIFALTFAKSSSFCEKKEA